MAELQQLEFYDMLLEQMTRSMDPSSKEKIFKLMTTPKEVGFNLDENFALFSKMNAQESFYGMLFAVSDAKAVEEMALGAMGDAERTETPDGLISIQAKDNTALLLKGNMGMILGGNLQIDFEQTYDYTEEDWALWEQQQAAAVSGWGASVINKKFDRGLSASAEFKKAMAQASDIHFWIDYGGIVESGMGDALGRMGGMSTLGIPGNSMKMLLDMYKDLRISFRMNFDPGAVHVDAQLFAGEKMLDMYRGAMKNKSNKKLARYIPQGDLLGYMHFNYNVEKTVEGIKSLIRDMMKDDPQYGEMAIGAMDIMDIVVDEDALYELFKGDLTLAFTGVESFEKTIITYEYDDNFNATEVEKTVTERFPEFTLMASYGNEENLMKLVKLGVNTKGLVPSGKYYVIENETFPMPMFLALHDGILFFTNNADLVQNRLQGGYDQSTRMNKHHAKMLKKHSQVFFWDIPKTSELMAGMEMPLPSEAQALFSGGEKSFKSLTVTAPKKVGDSVNSKFVLEMGSEEENALSFLFKMIDEMVLERMGGSKS